MAEASRQYARPTVHDHPARPHNHDSRQPWLPALCLAMRPPQAAGSLRQLSLQPFPLRVKTAHINAMGTVSLGSSVCRPVCRSQQKFLVCLGLDWTCASSDSWARVGKSRLAAPADLLQGDADIVPRSFLVSGPLLHKEYGDTDTLDLYKQDCHSN